jgi:hypothetical protein
MILQPTIRKSPTEGERKIGFLIFCPGCNELHPISVFEKNSLGAQWVWNGSEERPTFTPSLLLKYNERGGSAVVCHSYIKDGNIEFLSDCTHGLSGKTVPLPHIPE